MAVAGRRPCNRRGLALVSIVSNFAASTGHRWLREYRDRLSVWRALPIDRRSNVSGKTIAEAWRDIAGERAWDRRPAWPPDVFAFTSVVLADAGAYRLVVSPHSEASEHQWPPSLEHPSEDE